MNIKDKKVWNRIVTIVYETIFKMSDNDLLLHYEEVKKELEKRGVLCSK